MEKSPIRIKLEQEIENVHKASLDVAMKMIREEFGGDMEKALSCQEFITRMHAKIAVERQRYLDAYKKLEKLEIREGFPGMQCYAEWLDRIQNSLQPKNRECCYYPFSGIDFYWARIFPRIVFEDIGFDKTSTEKNMWWNFPMYSKRKRDAIFAMLQEVGIIPKLFFMKCISGDAEIERAENDFNSSAVTLLVKGGHDVLGFLEKRFQGNPILFGAIITVSAVHPVPEMEQWLSRYAYIRMFSSDGEDLYVPYAMGLRDIHIFTKNC